MKTAALVIAAMACQTSALSAPKQETGRRQALGWMGAAAIAIAAPQQAKATAAKTGAASPFTGDYDDPNHPSCLRQVKVVGAPQRADGSRSAYPLIEVIGYDATSGTTCTDRPTRADLWKAQGTVKSNTEASIDFSTKGGPANLVARFEDGGIVFPDGNKWTKLVLPSNDRRPKDMSTLKSN